MMFSGSFYPKLPIPGRLLERPGLEHRHQLQDVRGRNGANSGLSSCGLQLPPPDFKVRWIQCLVPLIVLLNDRAENAITDFNM